MITRATGVLQAATTIAKTTQTLVGSEIKCDGYEYLTLFFSYTKGDETGVKIVANMLRTSGGTEYPYAVKTETGGATTLTATTLTLTATRTSYITFDVRGIPIIKFTQGGSNNDGTPTGTLAASYAMS